MSPFEKSQIALRVGRGQARGTTRLLCTCSDGWNPGCLHRTKAKMWPHTNPSLLLWMALILTALMGCGSSPAPSATAKPASPLALVDVFVATGGSGYGAGGAYPGATRPFGMVRLSPDTHGGRFGRAFFNHFGGYAYGDTQIEGFSHTHLYGVGMFEYGNITVMPTYGMSNAKTRWQGYSMGFTHEEETAYPGYYRVRLADGIVAELTATPHVGVHRYTYVYRRGEPPPVLLFDLGHAIEGVDMDRGALTLSPTRQHITGWVHTTGGLSKIFGGQTIFVDATISPLSKEVGVWADGVTYPGQLSQSAVGKAGTLSLGAYFHFQPPQEVTTFTVELQVGLSFVSATNATQNRIQETEGRTFDSLQQEAVAQWQQVLGLISVSGGSAKQRAIFYTSLYHVFQMPTLYSDTNGAYRYAGQVENAGDFRFYSDMSLWDTYRTVHPLLSLIAPRTQRDFVRSIAAMTRLQGHPPLWPMGTGDAQSMVGRPAAIVIADSYLRGVTDFDAASMFAALVAEAVSGPVDISPESWRFYQHQGYLPAEKVKGSVSVTLEDMYADFVLSRFATALGQNEYASLFQDRAGKFPELWDSTGKIFRGRNSDGSWSSATVETLRWTRDYVEGNALQYRWFVPWAVTGLADLLGGPEPMMQALDTFFEESYAHPVQYAAGIRLPDIYYWHGNEPDIHAPYLYTLLGHPERSAPVIRWVMESKYDLSPAGLDGNDDAGTLSAWYVWSAIGLYPLPGESRYLIGSPLFTRTQFGVPNGKTVVIEAPRTSRDNMYVGRATWNGTLLCHPWIEQQQLFQGGVLLLEMEATPTSPVPCP